MKEGKRILSDPKFNVLDKSWDASDIAATGHQLYSIMTQEIYAITEQEAETLTVPEAVCDRKWVSKPEYLGVREKNGKTICKKMWSFRRNPEKVERLYGYIIKLINDYRREAGLKPKKNCVFRLISFTTVSPQGKKCLWKISTKTKENNQPVLFPVLTKIDGIDACMFSYKEVIDIAGEMVFDECVMMRRETSTVACERSIMTRKGRTRTAKNKK